MQRLRPALFAIEFAQGLLVSLAYIGLGDSITYFDTFGCFHTAQFFPDTVNDTLPGEAITLSQYNHRLDRLSGMMPSKLSTPLPEFIRRYRGGCLSYTAKISMPTLAILEAGRALQTLS